MSSILDKPNPPAKIRKNIIVGTFWNNATSKNDADVISAQKLK